MLSSAQHSGVIDSIKVPMPIRNRCASPNIICLLLLCAATAMPSPAQTFTTIARFSLTNGLQPGPLTLGTDGNFYGSTFFGGDLSTCGGYGCGTIFKLTPAGALTTLYSFNGTDGVNPDRLVQGSDGNFYGMTSCSLQQGREGLSLSARNSRSKKSLPNGSVLFCEGPGSVFRISPDGVLVFLHTFNGADGWLGVGALVEGTDGNFYGASGLGGARQDGTIFKMTPSGVLTALYSFAGADGSSPQGGLVQATDGNFYGTTQAGGADNQGTVFKMTPSGTLTSLHSFATTDGAIPNGSLVQATDGNFYGTTALGGANACPAPESTCGAVFKMTPGGALTMLYNFAGLDGANPNAGLVQAADGNFYGTTYLGGPVDVGTVFRINSGGTLSTLHSLCSDLNCADGTAPNGPLVQGADGLLYGTAALGGGVSTCDSGAGCGTVFSTGPTSGPYQFVPLTPCRLWDSRGGTPLAGRTVTVFSILELSQAFGCGDLSSATAFSLNVTVVPHGRLGYLTVWPTGEGHPQVSMLNSPDGRIKANAAIVPAGSGYYPPGDVSFYPSDTTDFILDINGYFTTPGSQTLAFYPLTPCRAVDTRNGQDDGTLHAGMERDYALSGKCGIPDSAAAYSLNVTAIPAPGGLDYLTVWPQGEPRPLVSTLNDATGTVVANAAIVSSGNNQTVAFYPNSNNTDLLVDVNGYFAAPGPGGYSYHSVPPCRIYDSRNNDGQPFSGERTINIATEPCAPPGNAQAFVFNATVVPSSSLAYLTLWPDLEQQPVVSTLNAYDGFITSNMAIVPTSNGSIDAYAAGLTQLILDISGYFAP